MAHEHGPHFCLCTICGYRQEVAEYIKCNTLLCPIDGSRMRAEETGEYRISESVGSVIPIDDQPIDATFFGEVRRLTDFITPDALEVETLYKQLTEGVTASRDKIIACWKWVASQVKYVKFVKGKLWINGKSSVQDDLWLLPESTIRTQVGNCATKSFLLTSLIRNELSPEQVYCTLGNLHNGTPGGHAWCLSPNALINCGGQLKTIEKIEPGTTVMTQTGNISKVTSVLTRTYTGEILHITRVYNPAFPLTITPEHPVLTPSGWRKAGMLRHGKAEDGRIQYIGEPIPRKVIDRNSWQKNISYRYKYYSRRFNYEIPVNEETLRLAGYYLAEGVLRPGKRAGKSRKTPDPTVIFYFNKSEENYINDVISLIAKYFHTKTRVYPSRQDDDAVRVETKSRGLYEFLSEFGRHAEKKEMPSWVMMLPPSKQIGVIQGYFHGDGCSYKNQFSFSSASINLIEDVRILLLRLNILASLSCANGESRTPEKGYYGNSQSQYKLDIIGKFAKRFADIFSLSIEYTPRSSMWVNPLILGDTAYYPIRQVTKEQVVNMPVYNLSVEGDESYIANGCAVHNCTLKLNDENSIMESTMPTAPPMVPVSAAKRYEAVHYFNDKNVLAVEGKTQLIPFCDCYSEWLNEYLHWAYIEGGRR